MKTTIFEELNLSHQLQRAIKDMGFEEATPIQHQAIPVILDGQDIIGQAQTGTGKTCAFGIPAIEMLEPHDNGVQILILCPTRELAIQVSEELKCISKYKEGIRILPIYGGQPIDHQIIALKKRPQVIIGTPGRIMDHMRRHTLKFSNLKMLILDEADEMLNMGFREDIDTILEKVPQQKQTIFFSATMPRAIIELTKKYQNNPEHIVIKHKQRTVSAIKQFYLEIGHSAKLEVLSRLIDANNITLSLVFCNTKKTVDELTTSLQSRGYSAEALHGDMRQIQRDRVMSKFRKGDINILIATDVAARGIDVDNVEAIFNYDVPNDDEYYIHRIGRTGRAGRAGKAFTFVVGREVRKLKDIERYTKSEIQLIKPPTTLDIEESKVAIALDKVKKSLSEKSFNKYASYIEKTLEGLGYSEIEVAAALLKLIIEQNSKASDDIDFDEVILNKKSWYPNQKQNRKNRPFTQRKSRKNQAKKK